MQKLKNLKLYHIHYFINRYDYIEKKFNFQIKKNWLLPAFLIY